MAVASLHFGFWSLGPAGGGKYVGAPFPSYHDRAMEASDVGEVEWDITVELIRRLATAGCVKRAEPGGSREAVVFRLPGSA